MKDEFSYLSYYNLETPLETYLEVCFHGNSKSHQVYIKINHYAILPGSLVVSAHSCRKPRQQGWVSGGAQTQIEDSQPRGGTVDTEDATKCVGLFKG